MGMSRSFAFLILTAATLAAQDLEYWPLAPGNQWVYRASLGEPLTVTVARHEVVDGKTYAVLTGLPNTSLLRQDGARLMTYDRESRQEKVYLDFGAPLDRQVPSSVDRCNPTAAIVSRDATAKLPLGTFEGLIAVRYGPGPCADAGLTQDLFRPYVGLMRRTETSFTGPRHYDLVYGRINGVLVFSTPETGFAVHVAPDTNGWLVRMTLRHTVGEPLKLDFSSGQVFDITVKDERGQQIYTWSADKLFLAALQSLEVSGERSWSTLIPGVNRAGKYTVEAWLTTMGAQPFRASTIAVVEVGIGNN